jgi:hypothetical protein
MTHLKRKPWSRRLAGLLALAVGLGLYQMYLTPQKRAVRQRLAEADDRSKQAIDARLKPLADLFARGRQGARPFADEALSWNGKWQFVKGLVQGGRSHRAYLSDAFGEHVFTPAELQAAMEASVRAYLDDLEASEGEMLVALRADLADADRPAELLPPHLRGDEAFRREYRELADRVAGDIRQDVGVTVGREVGLIVASDVAAQVALQAAKAAAAEMGVGAGVLGTGAVAGVATLGVGIVVGIILDYLIDEVFRMAGYDPAEKIAAKVRDSLNTMEAALVRDPDLLSWASKGALRRRLEEIHTERSKLRRETVGRLLSEGGAK